MCLARAGQPERAHEIYEELAKLMEQADRPNAAMQKLQSDAAAVLGIETNNDQLQQQPGHTLPDLTTIKTDGR